MFDRQRRQTQIKNEGGGGKLIKNLEKQKKQNKKDLKYCYGYVTLCKSAPPPVPTPLIGLDGHGHFLLFYSP